MIFRATQSRQGSACHFLMEGVVCFCIFGIPENSPIFSKTTDWRKLIFSENSKKLSLCTRTTLIRYELCLGLRCGNMCRRGVSK